MDKRSNKGRMSLFRWLLTATIVSSILLLQPKDQVFFVGASSRSASASNIISRNKICQHGNWCSRGGTNRDGSSSSLSWGKISNWGLFDTYRQRSQLNLSSSLSPVSLIKSRLLQIRSGGSLEDSSDDDETEDSRNSSDEGEEDSSDDEVSDDDAEDDTEVEDNGDTDEDESDNNEGSEDTESEGEEEEEEDDENISSSASLTKTKTNVSKNKKTRKVAKRKYDEPFVLPSGLEMAVTIGIMMSCRKFDLTEPKIVKRARFLFIAYIITMQIFLFYARFKANLDNDTTIIEVSNPLSNIMKSQLGGGNGDNAGNDVMKNMASSFLSSSMTILEYDLKQIKVKSTNILISMLMMWFLHFKMKQIQPLFLQTATGIMNMISDPLFQCYVLGKNLERPFKNAKAAKMQELQEQQQKQKEATATTEENDDLATAEDENKDGEDEEENDHDTDVDEEDEDDPDSDDDDSDDNDSDDDE